MSDNASIARPYAKAVFDLAEESNAFAEWSTALDQLAAISNDADFGALINDPRVTGKQLSELVLGVSKDSLPEGGENLINLLVQNDRLSALADIEEQYTQLVAKAQAKVNAEVITAMALSNDQKAALAGALEQRLGLKVEIEEIVDDSLIGGAIVKAGDLVIDGSAKGRIEKLSTVLAR